MKVFITLTGVICCVLLPHVCHGEQDQPEGSASPNADATQVRAVQLAVSGYEPAFEFLANELSQHARKKDLLVVWLFDESASMKDDQKEIADTFLKTHQAIQDDLRKHDPTKNTAEAVKYCVLGYGAMMHPVLKDPSADPENVLKSIEKIPVDKLRQFNTFGSIGSVLTYFSKPATNLGRRVVLIVVTATSSRDGDDDEELESVIANAKQIASPVYVLGREATFGYRYSRIRWTDPVDRLVHWIQVHRGPESAVPESLQWDGLRERTDIQAAGCGPYPLVRLARESGGAFLIIPHGQSTGFAPGPVRKGTTLLPEEYLPSYEPRKEYLIKVERSQFRAAVLDAVRLVNPSRDSKLTIRESGYPLDAEEYQRESENQIRKIQHALQKIDESISRLDEVQTLREQEPSARWQAHYDLISAQLSTYRIRLHQTVLVLVDHLTANPEVKNDKSNQWKLFRTKKLILPDEALYEQLQNSLKLTTTREEYVKQLEADAITANQQLKQISERHPDTPWSDRARYESQAGFGMTLRDLYVPVPHRPTTRPPIF